MLRKNKKGSIIDIAFLLVALLALGIFILVVAKVFPSITTQLAKTQIGSDPASQGALNYTDDLAHRGDMVFMFIFIGLSIAIMITSFFIETSPILIPVYIIALAILIIFAVVSQKVYLSFSTSATFNAISYPIVDFIMSNLVMIAIGVGVLSLILMFAKRGFAGGNSGFA